MTASNTAFTVCSGIGFILSIIPLWWHIHSWKVLLGTSMCMIWTALACLVFFVDSIVWNGNVINWAPVWCDIVLRIQVGFGVGLPACALCIIRRMYRITVTTTPHGIRRETITELLITVGIPLLEMVMQYVAAGHRFDIIEDYGCALATYNTPLAYVLVLSWPLIIGIISACYGALTIRAFFQRRKQLRDLDADFTRRNYWRLIALASIDYIFTIPIASWTLSSVSSNSRVHPWISWDDTHWGYSHVMQYPRDLLPPYQALSLELYRWTPVFCAFSFFAFFGFAEEARKNYRLLASTLAKLIGYTAFTEGAATTGPGVDMSLQFASRTFATQQTESIMGPDVFSDKPSISSAADERDLNLRPHSAMEQQISSSSSSPRIEVVPRVPEPALEMPDPVVTEAVHSDGAVDQV
ncbi:STE3-domain-containing protein [Thelephora terrestris]|uniref:STE3-domain-containing protein n=1 Tax=Thelephora terrestris TaxID=56493 RepID=A0A9P6HI16_9AGAM|nr:STE3-domain-containing protein [Thelephora terrestris]